MSSMTHPIKERQRPGYRSNTSTQRPILLTVLLTSPVLAASKASVLWGSGEVHGRMTDSSGCISCVRVNAAGFCYIRSPT